VEYLIKWKGYDKPEDNTWESKDDCHCPDLIKAFEKYAMRKQQASGEKKSLKAIKEEEEKSGEKKKRMGNAKKKEFISKAVVLSSDSKGGNFELVNPVEQQSYSMTADKSDETSDQPFLEETILRQSVWLSVGT